MTIPASEIQTRIENLQKSLARSNIDAVFIIQKIDLYYFSGTLQQGILFVPQEGEPFLFIRRDFERAKKESPLKNIIEIKGLTNIISIINQVDVKLEKIGLELDILPVSYFNRICQIFPTKKFIDFSYNIRLIRTIKSQWEIEKIKMAGKLITETFEEIKNFIKEGLSELDIAYETEYIARKKGHTGIIRTRAFNQEMFYGHYLSGENSLILSYVDSPTAGEGQGSFFSQGAGNKKLKKGEPLSIDFVFSYDGYCVDMTRIFFLGKPPEDYSTVYSVAQQIHEVSRELKNEQIECSQLYKIAEKIVIKNNLSEIFMGPRGRSVGYIGHGIGLELDELPILTKTSKEIISDGVVFALEPKFFIPNLGVAGIETTYLMTKKGLLSLTTFPESIQIIN
ncbi:MAG: Xaa-Pro peptidase family protein [Proteobacteria bacterium]|nr:Xaa-Pro peptidase family protein [Pseudomonadota bacterium]